jgi:hypothetical protein
MIMYRPELYPPRICRVVVITCKCMEDFTFV